MNETLLRSYEREEYVAPFFDQLEKLQELDLEIGALATLRETGPREIQGLMKELGALESTMNLEQTKLKKLQVDLQQRSSQLDQENRMNKMKQERLPEVRNQKEYQASSRELDASRMEIAALEGDLEIIEERIKHQEEVYQRIRKSYDEAAAVLQGKKEALNQQISQFETQAAQLQSRRAEILGGVPAAVLSKYERIRKKTKEAILLPVKATMCPRCNLFLAPQRMNELRRMEDVMICESCQGILYWREETPAP